MLFPLYYAIAGSLMSDAALVAFPPALFPTELAWHNYARVMQAFPLARQYLNSMLVSLSIVTGVLVTSVLSAYAFAFLDFPFRRTAFAAFETVGLTDVVRPIVPDGYTYWDYKQLRFPRNEGLRIDFILGSSAFADRVVDAAIHRNERKGDAPSDHVPVLVELAEASTADDDDDRPMIW